MKLPATGDLTGRAVPEWIGRTPNSIPPKAVVDRLFLRQRGKCPIAKRNILRGDKTEVDHIVSLKDGGENRESNLQIILAEKHRVKTDDENRARAKERRVRMKNNGTWFKSRNPMRSRGFAKRGTYDHTPDT